MPVLVCVSYVFLCISERAMRQSTNPQYFLYTHTAVRLFYYHIGLCAVGGRVRGEESRTAEERKQRKKNFYMSQLVG